MAGETLESKIRITGDSSDAERAIVATINELDKLVVDLKKPLGKISAFEDATAGLSALQSSLDESKAKLAYFKDQASKAGADGARAFAADIRATEREVTRNNSAVNQAAAKLRDMESALTEAGVDTRNLASEKNRLAASVANAERGSIRMKGALLEERTAASGAAEKTKEAGNAAQKAGEQSEKGASGAMSMAAGLKALAGAAAVREFVQANASLEGMTKALESVTGSSEQAKKEMEFVRAEAGRLGLDISSAANSYVQLSAAAKGTTLEGEQTRQIWSAVAESMARLGKSAADTDGALLAISQMMSKGVVSAEELRGQLGERLPGAFQIAARAVGTTTQGLGEMLQKGEIIAADFLPKFAAELQKTAGDGGAITTFNSQLARLKNAFNEVLVSIGDTGIFNAMSLALGKLADSVSFATLGFKGLAAAIRGDDETLTKVRSQLEEVKNRLLGVEGSAKKAGPAMTEMASSVSTAASDIERDVSEKILASLIKLDGSIKTTDAAFKKLGVDPGEITNGIGIAEREIIESFKRIAADPNSNGAVLTTSLLMALDKVSKEAVPEIGFAYKAAANAGRQSADELATGLNALTTKAKGLWDEMNRGKKQTDDLTAAYKTLGITSQAELQKSADSAKAAYEQIKAGGASINDQAAAWKAYAEKAIAANGGVASGMIQAEAAQHGYTIAVDESGKANIRLKKVVEDTGRAAVDAALEATRAMEQMAAQSARAFTETYGGTGTMQSSINDFHARLQGLGDVMSSNLNAARQQLHDATNGSIAAMDELRRYMTSNVGWERGGGISAYIAHVFSGVEKITKAYEEQMDRVRAAQSALESNQYTLANINGEVVQSFANTIQAAQDAAYYAEYLGDEDLAPLRNAIADANRRMLDLRAAASDTLSSIQDEWDQLNNNLDEIEQRRADKRQAEVDAQLAEARAAGDKTAIADLEKASNLIKKIGDVRISDAAAREKAAGEASKPEQPAKQTSSSHQVSITLNGRKTTINTASATDAAGLTAFIKDLESAMKRSA